MTINGQPVSRSEFEYSYNKNNAEGVIDKKTVEEYVDLFINYKLKVKEIPHVQGKRNPSKTVGVVRGHQRADTLKP